MGELIELSDFRPDCEDEDTGKGSAVWIFPDADSKGRQRLYIESLCEHCLRNWIDGLGISAEIGPVDGGEVRLNEPELDISIAAPLTKFRAEIPLDRNTRRSLKHLVKCMAKASR